MFGTRNLRGILWATLAMALFMNYITWMRDYPASAPPAGASVPTPGAAAPGGAPALGSAAPALSAPVAPAAPAHPAPLAAGAPAIPGTSAAMSVGSTLAPAAPLVRVLTDVLDVQVSLQGGELTRADLLAYPLVKGQPSPVRLLNRDSDES